MLFINSSIAYTLGGVFTSKHKTDPIEKFLNSNEVSEISTGSIRVMNTISRQFDCLLIV